MENKTAAGGVGRGRIHDSTEILAFRLHAVSRIITTEVDRDHFFSEVNVQE